MSDRPFPAAARWRSAATLAVSVILLAGVSACGSDEAPQVTDAEKAQSELSAAERAVTSAEQAFDEAGTSFCTDAEAYIGVIDGYGDILDASETTVGDVTTAGADLEEPRSSVESAAETVQSTRDDLAAAEADLVAAQAALEAAEAGESAPSTTATTTTTTPLVPPATVDRVRQAEEDLAAAVGSITDETALTEAGEQFNAAAFALEVAWLKLYADAGCLDDQQAAAASQAVRDYTVALQTSLTTAGHFSGEIDGVYGPSTVEAVEALQQASGLPVTGLVDKATADALEAAVTANGGETASQALVQTSAVQTTLKLAGYWDGPVDGQWTPELTTALETFQSDLGVPVTGAVDAATLSALEQSLAADDEAVSATTTTTVAEPAVSSTTTTVP